MKMPPQVLSVTAFFLFQKNFPLCIQNFPLLNEKLGEFANISKDLQSTN